MSNKSKKNVLLYEYEIEEKLEEAGRLATGTLEDENITTQTKNWSYNPHDLSYDAEPEFEYETKVIPKGTGKNYYAAIELYNEIEKDLTTKLNLLKINTSAYKGEDLQEANIKQSKLGNKISDVRNKKQLLETELDKTIFKPKIDKLLSGYKELLEHYEDNVKSKYGNNFFDKDFDKDDLMKATNFLSEKNKYHDQSTESKDPGPLLLWVATSNMIESLENTGEEVNSKNAHKPFSNTIKAWKELNKGEDGQIIKADRGDLATRIGNEIARILNFLVTLEYKQDLEVFKSRGKEQQETKVQEIIDLSKSMKP